MDGLTQVDWVKKELTKVEGQKQIHKAKYYELQDKGRDSVWFGLWKLDLGVRLCTKLQQQSISAIMAVSYRSLVIIIKLLVVDILTPPRSHLKISPKLDSRNMHGQRLRRRR